MGKYFEPWESENSNDVTCRRGTVAYPTDGYSASLGHGWCWPFEKALAARIAACVTACEGIPMGRLWEWNKCGNITAAIRRAFEEGKSSQCDFYESKVYAELVSGVDYNGPVEEHELKVLERAFAKQHKVPLSQLQTTLYLGWPHLQSYYSEEEDVL